MKKIVILAIVFALIFAILPTGVVADSGYVPKTINLIPNPDGTVSLPEGCTVYLGDTLVFPRDEMVLLGDFEVRNGGGEIRENAVGVVNDIMISIDGVQIGGGWVNEYPLNDSTINNGTNYWFDTGSKFTAGEYTFNVVSAHDAAWTEQYVINPPLTVLKVKVLDPETDYKPDNRPAFAVESKSATAGETFDVDISINDNGGITDLTLDVDYDAYFLEFVSATAGDSFAGATFDDGDEFPLSIHWEGENTTANGTLATLTFKVKSGIVHTNTVVAITNAEVYDAESEKITYTAEFGKISIECLPGDVNSDGEINNKDLGVLRRFLNDWDVEINMHTSDVNGDGEVNNKDLGVLRRFLNDWDVELVCPDTTHDPADDYVVVQKTAAEKATMKRVKLLMMGDSTTAGDGSEAAFRFSMYQKLYEEGCFFELVGDKASIDYRLTSSYNGHLAQGGRTIDQLKNTYASSVAGGKIKYDIAVITIGVNDLYGGTTGEALRPKYRALLDTMFNDRPDAKVYFAELIWMPDLPDSWLTATDKMIAELVDEYKGKGYDITLLKHDENSDYSKANKDHIITFGPSGNHPNHVGNYEIGLGYAAVLKDVILEMNKQPAPAGQAKVIDPTSVALSKTDASLKINEQVKLQYTVSPANADVKSVVWTSSNTEVATVDFQGIITAHKAGKATITARVVGTSIKASCKVTVTEEKMSITAAGNTTLLTDAFTSTTYWSNANNFISNGEMRVAWTSGLNAQTKRGYNISKDAGSISFKCVILEHMGTTDASRRLSVSFGKYELQLCNSQATVNLLYNGQVIGTYKNSPQFYPPDNYLINFVDGKVTVYRNNENLITADAPADATGRVNVTFQSYGTMAIDDLVIKSGK